METTTRKYRLPRLVIIKANGLLPMLYTPRELSEELNVPDSTLRDWLQAGIPTERDQTGHLWINGEKFAAWVKEQQHPRTKYKLGEGEGFCMTCRKVVRMENPTIHTGRGKLIHIKGPCPNCGTMITRGGRLDRAQELSQN